VGFNGFEAAAEGPIKLGKDAPKGSFIVDYRYSTMQLVGKLGMNAGTGTAIPEYNDLSVIVDLPTPRMGRFKYVGIYGNSFIRLNRSFDKAEATTHSQVGFATDFGAALSVSILTHTLMLSENTKLKTSISYQNSSSTTLNDTIDYENQTYFTNYAGKLAEKKEIISTLLKHKFSAQNNVSAGLFVNRFSTSFKDSAYVKSLDKRILLTDVNKEPSILYEGYVNWQHKFSDNLTLNSGVHYQYYDLNRESALEPRFGLQWQFTANQSLSLGYGLHSQIQPRSVYFYKEYHNGVYSENNHDLKFTRSHQLVLGYDWHLGNDFRIKAETYYQSLYNVPVSRVNNEFSMLNAGSGYYIQRLDSLENTGKGRNYGIEVTAEKFLSDGWYALTTISLYDSKYQGFDHQWRNTAFNSNFAVNALAGYEWKVGKKNYLTLDLRTVWSGGMRYIPIDLPASIAAGEQVFDAAHTYSDKYKAYFRTDLRIGFKQNLGKISQEWGLDLQNITNHDNLFSEQYNNQLQEVTTIYQQAFMPMMLYRINF
ncbi:MAG: TonB-dependent receptor, partial [Bacteroidia bacterium]|nr:TonB-dependent receptor [Bacteroidia bacterium]